MNIFESIGVYTPEKKVSTKELVGAIRKNPPFFLEKMTGIVRRSYRGEDEDSFSIALNAARHCLSRSRYTAEDIDIIIYAGITRFRDGLRFQYEPALSLLLKNALGAAKAINVDINNACAGMLTGVFILDTMIRSGAVRRGIVISGECITPIADTAVIEVTERLDRQIASLTVGDAGAAVIVDGSLSQDRGIHYSWMATFAEYSDLCMGMPSDCSAGPAMYTDSSTLHRKASERINWALEQTFLYHRGNSRFDRSITHAVPHQTSIKAMTEAIDEVKNYFQIPCEEAPFIVSNITDFGNTASTSHFLTLFHKMESGEIKPGTTIILCALASGIVIGYIVATVGGEEAA